MKKAEALLRAMEVAEEVSEEVSKEIDREQSENKEIHAAGGE